MLTPKNLKEVVPDLGKWPESWMGEKEDLEYGKKLLPMMEQFLNKLICRNLSRKTLKNYADSLWFLGGTVIKEVSLYRQYKKDPLKKLMEVVEGSEDLPGDYEAMSKSELASLKKMGVEFEEFLKGLSKVLHSKQEKVRQIVKEKKIIEEKTEKLIAMTAAFSQKHLDDDCRQLCEKLIRKISRK
jgi:hypothetical protein